MAAPPGRPANRGVCASRALGQPHFGGRQRGVTQSLRLPKVRQVGRARAVLMCNCRASTLGFDAAIAHPSTSSSTSAVFSRMSGSLPRDSTLSRTSGSVFQPRRLKRHLVSVCRQELATVEFTPAGLAH